MLTAHADKHGRLWDLVRLILGDLERPRTERRFVTTGSYVVDRKLDELCDGGYVVWVQVHPDHTSLVEDHYALTDKGRDLLAADRAFTRRVGMQWKPR